MLCLVSKLPHEGESGALMHLEKSVVAAEPMTCWQYHKWEEMGMATSKKISFKGNGGGETAQNCINYCCFLAIHFILPLSKLFYVKPGILGTCS